MGESTSCLIGFPGLETNPRTTMMLSSELRSGWQQRSQKYPNSAMSLLVLSHELLKINLLGLKLCIVRSSSTENSLKMLNMLHPACWTLLAIKCLLKNEDRLNKPQLSSNKDTTPSWMQWLIGALIWKAH